MPSISLDFRASCGCFCAVFQNFMLKRAKRKKATHVAMLNLRRGADGVIVGLLLSYLFWGSLLLRCGDVETNPGPITSQSKDNMKQTRLSSTRSSSTRVSIEKPGNPSEEVKDPTLSDVMGMLQSMKTMMDTRFGEVKEEMHILREEYVAMQDELRALRGEIGGLREQNEDLQRKNKDLSTKLEDLERKTDDLEGRSKRNNLIFYGLPRKNNETTADCEGMVKDLITDKLELSQDMEFDRVHRINSKSDSPVIARCVFYKQKIAVLKAKSKLRGTNVFVSEDFSGHVREIRRRLTPHLKKARKDGKRATMVFNHLLIDGKNFTVDHDDRLVEVK